MSAQHIRPLLSAYLDNEVTPAEQRQVEEHLVQCADCAAALADYRRIGSTVRSLSRPVPPPTLHRDVWTAIEARRSAPAWGPLLSGALRFGAVGAVALAAIIVAVIILAPKSAGRVQMASPADGQTNVPTNALVHLQFDPPVQEDTTGHVLMSATDIISRDLYVKWVGNPGSEMVLGPSTEAIPSAEWKPNTTYTVIITAPVKAQDGTVVLSQDKTFHFTTGTTFGPTETPTATATSTPVPTNTPAPPTEVVPPTATAVVVPPTPEPPAPTPPIIVVPSVTAEPPTVGPPPPSTPEPGPTTPPAPGTVTPLPPAPTPPSVTPIPPSPVPPTATPLPPSATPAPPTATPPLPTPVRTEPPGPIPIGTTPTPTPASGGLPPSPTPRRNSPTPTPPAPTATPPTPVAGSCNITPRRGFGKVYDEHPAVAQRIGCPSAPEGTLGVAAEQSFERGYMFWDGDNKRIYVFYSAGNTWHVYVDTWVEGSPPAEVLTPPAGLFQPVRGFGKVWLEQAGVRAGLGWAINQERQVVAAVWQPYDHGAMLWTDAHIIRVLYNSGGWELYYDTFQGP